MIGSKRLGVLDVGSNTVHLLVVDAHRGARPTPMTSEKTELRLAERIDAAGRLTGEGAAALVDAVARAAAQAADAGCIEVLAFATSALRDATNSASVTARVRSETGVALRLLPGEAEARYTFLAARRWCGWSAGRLLVLDIGGGSLELAAGDDEHPDVAVSVPLGAGRMTRDWFRADPPERSEVAALEAHADAVLAPVARKLRERRSPGPVRRHVEDLPLAGPADRGSARPDRGRAGSAARLRHPHVVPRPRRAQGGEPGPRAPARRRGDRRAGRDARAARP